jgi:hypothetical protein
MTRELMPIDQEILRQVFEAMEAAGVSGLCRDGRLEVGLQEARKLLPLLDEDALRRLVEECDAG